MNTDVMNVLRGRMALPTACLITLIGNVAGGTINVAAQTGSAEVVAVLNGQWNASMYEGNFVFQFSRDGAYHYRFMTTDGVLVAEHDGTFSVRQSNESEQPWPAVDGGGGQMPRYPGLVIQLRPSTIQKPSSNQSRFLLGDLAAEFRLSFNRDFSGFRILHVDQGPRQEYGHLRFRRGGRP